jgi:hypothetical protein
MFHGEITPLRENFPIYALGPDNHDSVQGFVLFTLPEKKCQIKPLKNQMDRIARPACPWRMQTWSVIWRGADKNVAI